MVKVENIISSKGNPIPNQFIIEVDGDVYFQSYKSIIAKIDKLGNVTLDERYWDYSITTGRYRNIFLGENKKETLEKIESGKYKLANLNE